MHVRKFVPENHTENFASFSVKYDVVIIISDISSLSLFHDNRVLFLVYYYRINMISEIHNYL